MPTPSLYPLLMKAVAEGNIVAAGTEYIETFDLDVVLDSINVDVVDDAVGVELIGIVDVEIAETEVAVDVVCTDFRASETSGFDTGFDEGFK